MDVRARFVARGRGGFQRGGSTASAEWNRFVEPHSNRLARFSERPGGDPLPRWVARLLFYGSVSLSQAGIDGAFDLTRESGVGMLESRGREDQQMPRLYRSKFRRQVIDLARAGTAVKRVAATFQMSDATICSWLKQDRIDRDAAEGRDHQPAPGDRRGQATD